MSKFDQICRGDEDPRKWSAQRQAAATSEAVLSKEQLYEMFQNIVHVKKYEHQILYNAMQVGHFVEVWSFYAPCPGGAFWNSAIRPSVCLYHGAAA